MVYLNVAGLSPFKREVHEEVTATLKKFSQLLYSEAGVDYYRQTLQRARQQLAEWLHVENSQQIAFVPNATTASWLILSRLIWKPGDGLLTTTHENSTVLNEIFALRSRGVAVHSLDPTSPSELLTQIEQLLASARIRAIVISHVSHIDGRIFPIERISQLARDHQVLLIIDGAQAVGHIPVNLRDLHADAYFFPGHKWCAGPMGTGALILGKTFSERDEIANSKEEEEPHPPWAGFELGTQNLGLIAGFAKACTIKQQEGLQTETLEAFRREVRHTCSILPGIQCLEWEGPHAPGIFSFQCVGQPKSQALFHSTSTTKSIAWKTFSTPTTPAHTGIRLSWSLQTPIADVQYALTFLTNILGSVE